MLGRTLGMTPGFTARSFQQTVGPNDTEMYDMSFAMNLMPMAGALAIPLLVLSIITLSRKSIVPNIGDRMLRCVAGAP